MFRPWRDNGEDTYGMTMDDAEVMFLSGLINDEALLIVDQEVTNKENIEVI